MRTGDELLDMIEEEINQTERCLVFWRQQETAQAGTELGKHIPAIVDGYDRQIQHLEDARKLFNA
jgi:hypothetical protein